MIVSSCITDGAALNALASLADFLRHPVIEVRSAPADVVTNLCKQVQQLETENAKVLSLYQNEVQICLRYEDYLKSIGVDPREVR